MNFKLKGGEAMKISALVEQARGFGLVGFFLLAPGLEAAVSCDPSPQVNRMWQCAITGAQNGAYAGMGAYKNIQLKIQFADQAVPSHNFAVYAFWDGGEGTSTSPATFRFRARFWKPATWLITSSCPAGPCPSLTGLPQSVTSTAYVPTGQVNLLHKWGPVFRCIYGHNDPTGTMHYFNALSYSSGPAFTPFPWIGEAAWAAPIRATGTELTTYLNDRNSLDPAKKGFTVVQIGIAPGWANPEHSATRIPFDTIATGCSVNYQLEEALPNNCSRPKPAFFSSLDSFVSAANDKGMLVFIAGVMEPVGGKDTDYAGDTDPDDSYDEDSYARYAPATVFARYMAARYSGHHVVLSPGFDTKPQEASNPINGENLLELMKQVGRELDRITPAYTLLSNHWATVSTSDMRKLAGESWLNFQMAQSGASFCRPGQGNCNDAERLRRVTERGRALVPSLIDDSNPSALGVVNGEGPYDLGEPIPLGATPPTFHRNDFRSRQVGYLSLLNGSFGYAIGIGGIWDWSLCSLNPEPAYCDEYGPRNPAYDHYSEGLQKSSAHQQRYFGHAMKRITPYSNRGSGRITYEQSRILNQPLDTDQQLKMAFMRDAFLLQAYLPRNDYILFRADGLYGNPSRNRWYNVRTGVYPTFVSPPVTKCTGGQNCSVQVTFCEANPSQCTYCGMFGSDFGCAFRNPTLNAFALEGANDFLLELELTTPGYRASWAGPTSLDFRALAGDIEGLSGWGIYGEFQDAAGQLVGSRFRIDSPATSVAPKNPNVAADGAGNYVVVWSDDTDLNGLQEIYGRFTDQNGNLGPLVHVSKESEADDVAPVVSMDEKERAYVAWTRRADKPAAIVVATLDQDDSSASDPIEVAGGAEKECSDAVVAAIKQGGIVVAWTERTAAGDSTVKSTRLSEDLIFTGGELALSGVSTGMLTPLRSFAAVNGTVTVEWEALGDDVFAARRSRTISPTDGLSSEQLMSAWAFDPPTPDVLGDDEPAP